MKLSHFFLPHPHTHKKAHLLSVKALLVYFLFFLLLQNSLNLIARFQPGVLGVSTVIDYHEVIRLTNIEREKNGLTPLSESQMLDGSAYEKAENMYQEDYWAHYSPSGKDPWGFMKTAGYSFSYAGENLARNFYSAQDVVNAWMASPTHRDNILNSHYSEIGISVNEGILQGQKTILVVQHFGKPVEYIAQKPVTANHPVTNIVYRPTGTPKSTPNVTPTPAPVIAQASETPSPTPTSLVQAKTTEIPTKLNNQSLVQGWSLDPYQITRVAGLTFIVFIGSLIFLDLYIIRRRMVHRFTSNHMSHFALLSLTANMLVHMTPGQIL